VIKVIKMSSEKFQVAITMNSTFISCQMEASTTQMVCTSIKRDLTKMEDITMSKEHTLIKMESLINFIARNKIIRKEGETTRKMMNLLNSLRRKLKKMTIMMRFKKSTIMNTRLKALRKSLEELMKKKICLMTKKKHQ
jgi:hypothetical protein